MRYFGSFVNVQAAYAGKDIRWQGDGGAAEAFRGGASGVIAWVCEHPPATMASVPESDGEDAHFRCVVCDEKFADKKKQAAKSITVRVERGEAA